MKIETMKDSRESRSVQRPADEIVAALSSILRLLRFLAAEKIGREEAQEAQKMKMQIRKDTMKSKRYGGLAEAFVAP